MSYKCEKELRERADIFIDKLKKAGIKGLILPSSIRDYYLEIYITKSDRIYGNVNIYYSPKRDMYTMQFKKLKDRFILPELEKCWYGKALSDDTIPGNSYHIYVNGVFLNELVGYGAVILRAGVIHKELAGIVPDYTKSHPVVGKLFALREALKWCRKNVMDNVSIFSDYEGLEKWASGEWEVKAGLIEKYKRFMDSCQVEFFWRKLESPADERWCDRAGEMGKKRIIKKSAKKEPD